MQLFLQTCTPQLEKSKNYFAALDFKLIDYEDNTLVYDQQVHILIDHQRSGRRGLTLVKENWDKEIAEIGQLVAIFQRENCHYFISPSGTRFALKSGLMVKIPPTQTKCILGNYSGISLETMDIVKSRKFMQVLGFVQSSGSVEQGWISCTDENNNTISLMAPFGCPHLFVNPSGTFFNSGANPEIIAEVRKRQIPIYEEVTAFNAKCEVDNIILQEPGGIGFFVFYD